MENNTLLQKDLVISDIQYIQALGDLLMYYYTDLRYILTFHRYKNGKFDPNKYLEKSDGTFLSFLIEFKVVRNIGKFEKDNLLQMTAEWINSNKSDNVDGFAELLNNKGISYGQVTSLASKILFLNNPWHILPLDNRTKRSFGLKNNIYADYLPLVQDFASKNKIDINRYLNSIDQYLSKIEDAFNNEIENPKEIRFNRFVDKILWTHGGQL
jgi:hypothetical protein